jgi:sugar phosphate isomerase/epimerase
MLTGVMNNPARPLLEQIDWIGAAGFDFIDLTLEPPGAASWGIDVPAVRELLRRHDLRVVGHTAPFLPIASPIDGLRKAAVAEFQRCMNVFRALDASWMNIHPATAPMHDWSYSVERNLLSLRELLSAAADDGLGLMIENVPGVFNTAAQLAEILGPIPELGLHLDIGHCNLMTLCNTEQEVLAAHAARLRHVHLHDNRGGNLDLHLPLGVGNLDLPSAIGALKSSGYDGTITLEIFTNDPNQLLYSRDVFKRTWDAVSV